MKYSVLDLCPVNEGENAAQALQNAISLAQHVENLGFPRIWYAEHHNLQGIASAATSIIMGQVLAKTTKIVVGAGGVMLPNHSPLVIAEQFGTLEALFPGRVELGLGRAPGTDQLTAHALRRHLDGNSDNFPSDVVELLNYFNDDKCALKVQAVPGSGSHIPVWILGSSLFGAQLAAALGLPYAFASHFAPVELMRALFVYREQFKPSDFLPKPIAMAALNVVVAQTDEEAKYLFSSQQQAFANLRTGNAGKLPAPVMHYTENLNPQLQAMLSQSLSCSIIGSVATVREKLRQFENDVSADQYIITSMIYDHEKRKNSFTLFADVLSNA